MLCPQCSAANPAGAKFCGKCGAALGGPAPAPERQKKSFPLVLVLVITGLLVGVGIVVAFIIFGMQSGGSHSEPTPQPTFLENYATPSSQPPEPAKTIDPDVAAAQKIAGTWRVRRLLSNGVYIDMQAIYLSNGAASWSGSVVSQGQSVFVVMSGVWNVKNGCFAIRVDNSNMPQLIQAGYTSTSRITTLTDDECTYVDLLTGDSETAIRVR